MKFLFLFVVCGLIAVLLGPIMPHWGLMLTIAFIAALVGGNCVYSFFSAALALGIIWFLVPFLITMKTGSDLPERMGEIMGIDHDFFLIVATSLIGFLLGGFGALTGNLFRKLFEKDKSLYYK